MYPVRGRNSRLTRYNTMTAVMSQFMMSTDEIASAIVDKGNGKNLQPNEPSTKINDNTNVVACAILTRACYIVAKFWKLHKFGIF